MWCWRSLIVFKQHGISKWYACCYCKCYRALLHRFLNLKKITFIENKTSTQTFLWKEQETLRLVYAAKKFGKSMVLFCEILLSKNGTALSTGTVLNYLDHQPKEIVQKNV